MWWRQVKAITLFPGMMAVVIPAVIFVFTGQSGRVTLSPVARGVSVGLGVLLVLFGLALFSWTVALFARRGNGTLSPFDSTTRLVVVGPYRHVRNPMYAGVFSVQIGEALTLQSWALLVWFGCFLAIVAIVVPRKEERWLTDQFGAEYAEYRAHVPRWIPRLTAWRPVPEEHRAATSAR